MDSTKADIPDCKVTVRRYLLVREPSQWGYPNFDRAVVQSPVLTIDSVSSVPAKRLTDNYEDEDAICFLDPQDFVNDSAKIYWRLKINRRYYETEAHGVALYDSPPEDDFQYTSGDPFWIHIGPDTSEYETTVPVINLHTYKHGIVPIKSVCWYPKVRGPGKEIWTLVGEKGILKHAGRKNFSRTSWAICQRLDGSAPTFKHQIISGYAARTIELLSTERRVLFERMYKFLTASETMETDKGKTATPLITPSCSISSDQEKSINNMDILEGSPSVQGTEPLSSPIMQNTETLCSPNFRKGTLEMTTRKDPSLQLHGSSKRPWMPFKKPLCSMHQMTRINEDQERSLEKARSTACKALPPQRILGSDEASYSSELPIMGSHDLIGPRILSDFSRADQELGDDGDVRITKDCQNKPQYFSVIDPTLVNRTTSIYELHQEHNAYQSRHKQDRLLARLCSRTQHDCPYSNQFPYKHYHSSGSKCHSPLITDGKPHVHCLTRQRDQPGQAGDCILSTTPSTMHSCCCGRMKNCAGWTMPQGQALVDRNLQEHKATGVKIVNRTSYAWQMNLDLGRHWESLI